MEDCTFISRTGGSYPNGKYHVHLSDTNTLRMAIYGDSFGDSGFIKLEKGVRNIERWWTTILARKMQAKIVDNYSASGTPFIFSYKNFLQNYKNYDINIVLVTQPNRYTKPIKLSIDYFIDELQYRAPNVPTLESIKKDKRLSKDDITHIDNLLNWYIVNDADFMKTAQNLMLTDILRLAPNTILVPCFSDSMNDLLNSTKCLTELFVYQYKLFGINMDDIKKYTERYDVIACHFTPEMNIAIADLIYERITTGKWNWDFPKVKHEHPIEYYYTLEN
jgi:hypothetical protein